MIRLLKVTGESLSPFFDAGDYVLALERRLWRRPIRPGDVVIFRHPDYGTLIKRVERLEDEGALAFVIGANLLSTDSRTFGAIPIAWITDRVIWRVHA